MYILQTTTAVLIAFLAIIAYSKVRNRLARAWPKEKDLETLHNSTGVPITDAKLPIQDTECKDASGSGEADVAEKELATLKQLYYKLHNLERYPEVLPECRQLLLALLSSTIADAIREPENTILSVEHFSLDDLKHFLKAKDINVTNQWEEYLARRRAGGPREMFGDKEEAKWWLKQAAPVKYVDGAWLGHINKISTTFKYRPITKNAWQVMSEELGDGDVAKNHVKVYQDLMDDIDARLPAADTEDFIHPRHGLSEVRCWKAALAQLTVSLFPHDFFPEALGFNMAYESLPLHLLKTVKELRELRLNPYYFELHISIDNSDSGHAAMAMAAVANYLRLIEADEGGEAAQIAWKRVQAGYILAEGLPTTPESPSLKPKTPERFPRTETEAQLIAIFAAKSSVAHKIHCNSRLRIGRRSLVDWLEPRAFEAAQWQREFLDDLSNCKPWVVRGRSSQSRLISELSWEGKMFGSFTEKEVGIVSAWIDELNWCRARSGRGLDLLTHYPVLCTHPPEPAAARCVRRESNDLRIGSDAKTLDVSASSSGVYVANLLPLWFASPALLEALPAVPVRAATSFGSAVVRVVRAQCGFSAEGTGVAGMDEVHRTDNGLAIGIVELGLEMCRSAGVDRPSNLRGAVAAFGEHTESFLFSENMLWRAMRWRAHRDLLVGMAWAFMELHLVLAQSEGCAGQLLSVQSRRILQAIALRERAGLEVCKLEIYGDEQRKADFSQGLAQARRAIQACFVTQ
ncbi:uncharacterized protein SETTUDRAFT_157115 [Exserohilum turcica Et28A]|uniref:Uncharacterized protein n=1 Tax=Exserohilum turcicum (strain 28A) TaxID=671987 RepID=R0JM20_EXST2|nr:uncharacterized protein SETTUDRAFT_157115 [Exserohilum turcica Et28A]EOA82288.1 hypothetical protein SETTUDRAFT_157115 [Exserohilum turcica Et28A]